MSLLCEFYSISQKSVHCMKTFKENHFGTQYYAMTVKSTYQGVGFVDGRELKVQTFSYPSVT
jgi:hypothetical protein